MAHFKIKQGYTVPIAGEAKQEIESLPKPPFVAMCPVEFPGLKPKLSVAVDERVKVGSPLFFDKKRPEVQFLAPASGKIAAINYGPRRVIEEIVIAADDDYEHQDFESLALGAVLDQSREAMVERLTKGGLWPLLRRRPYGKIAPTDETPKAIFVTAMNTAPLANDPNFSLEGKGEAFKCGVAAMTRLTDKVFVCTRGENPNPMFNVDDLDGVERHTFSGKHPAGLVGTHIGKLAPINKGESVWCLNARDAVAIGSFFLNGRYPVERVVALVGPGCQSPRYLRTQLGARIQDLVGDSAKEGDQRFISGDVLTGSAKSLESWLGFYDDMVTIIPEGVDQEFLGWLSPGLNKPSFFPLFLSNLMPKKTYEMDTNLHGGRRAIIQSGIYDEVVALDIYAEFLLKATIAQDIDQMERLGILECAPEDFALVTYICPSKTEASKIIAEGLELMEKEG